APPTRTRAPSSRTPSGSSRRSRPPPARRPPQAEAATAPAAAAAAAAATSRAAPGSSFGEPRRRLGDRGVALELTADRLQRPVQRHLDRVRLQVEQLADLARGQVGAVAQRDEL